MAHLMDRKDREREIGRDKDRKAQEREMPHRLRVTQSVPDSHPLEVDFGAGRGVLHVDLVGDSRHILTSIGLSTTTGEQLYIHCSYSTILVKTNSKITTLFKLFSTKALKGHGDFHKKP